jgi:hypothetical protein
LSQALDVSLQLIGRDRTRDQFGSGDAIDDDVREIRIGPDRSGLLQPVDEAFVKRGACLRTDPAQYPDAKRAKVDPFFVVRS